MGLICKLPEVLTQAKAEYENLKSAPFLLGEEVGQSGNILAEGDNAQFMKLLLDGDSDRVSLEGKIQQIYIDPPFFSKANYDAVIKLQGEDGETSVKHMAYEDVWKEGMAEYLKMLAVRLYLMRDLLAKEGTIWVHLDWHGVHYVKILMDEIFGEKNFINEIVWTYKSGGSSKKHFARKHDTILVYGKTDKYYINLPKEKSYNRGLKPYRFKGVEEFQDEVGWYTMVNMKDVWSIDMVGRTSAERTGYATQKPEALLERIIAAGSREGDIVADFFCGSGTLGAAAGKLGRRWICCDEGKLAVSASMKRLIKAGQEMQILRSEDAQAEALKQPVVESFLVEASTWPSLFENKTSCTIELKEYKLKEEDVVSSDEVQETIARTTDENPLALVDYWCIDFDCHDMKFRPDTFFFRDKKGLQAVCEKELETDTLPGRTIMVKVVDIFGNVSTSVHEGKLLLTEK
ncbi:MAG: site-specific DNA-methyltransferase [Firmicutes bacterium]|nr:site-specific DNA-methyltransferase [Bacillota bacterium]